MVRVRTIRGARKEFRLEVRENQGGQFLRILENRNGRRSMVTVPREEWSEFARVLRDVMDGNGTGGSAGMFE
jgi:hypothetical protein